jgi:hypothetical protein
MPDPTHDAWVHSFTGLDPVALAATASGAQRSGSPLPAAASATPAQAPAQPPAAGAAPAAAAAQAVPAAQAAQAAAEPPGDPQPATATSGIYQGASGQDRGNVGVAVTTQHGFGGSPSTTVGVAAAVGVAQRDHVGGIEAVGSVSGQADGTGTVTAGNLGPVGVHGFLAPDSARVNAGLYVGYQAALGQNPANRGLVSHGVAATAAVEGLIGGPSRDQPRVVVGGNVGIAYQQYNQVSPADGSGTPASLTNAVTATGVVNTQVNLDYYRDSRGQPSKTPRVTLYGEAGISHTGGGAYSDPATPAVTAESLGLTAGGGAMYNARVRDGRAIISVGAGAGAMQNWTTVGGRQSAAGGGYVNATVGVSWR